MSENQFVLPGDVILADDCNLGHNVTLESNKIMSTAIGFSEVKDNLITVSPLTGLYTPKPDDLVIGKIISHNALSWEVDINSYYSGILTASDTFGKDYSPSRDDLSLKLQTGDVILARIVNMGSRDPLITINGENLGKIDSGELIKISPTKISRFTESILQIIQASTNAIITIGQNGLIILKCEDSADLKKVNASIKMIVRAQHDVNIEEKIQKFLDENN